MNTEEPERFTWTAKELQADKEKHNRTTIGELKEILEDIPESYNDNEVIVYREDGKHYSPRIIDLGGGDETFFKNGTEVLLVI